MNQGREPWKNRPRVLAGDRLCSPTSVVTLSPIEVGRKDPGFPSFTDIWDTASATPSMGKLAPLQPHEIQIANLGPETREAKGICASTATCPLLKSCTGAIQPRFSKRLKPCLKASHNATSDTTTSTTPGAYRPPRAVKLVRFSVKSRRSKKYKPVNRTQAEAKASWWSRDELKQISTRELDVARCFLSRNLKYPSAMERLLLECFRAADISPGQQGAEESTAISYGEALQTVVNGHRGFEQAIIGRFDIQTVKLCYRIGKRCIWSVLEAQRRCKQAGAPPPQIEAELASQQSHFSTFAAQFAQIMGEGDAIVALQVQGNHTPFLASVAMHRQDTENVGASQQLLEV